MVRLPAEKKKALAGVIKAEITRRRSGSLWTPFPDPSPQRVHPQRQAMESKADILFYGGAAGGGKGLALDTPLPTPTGFTTMGEVAAGDVLLGADGRPCRVTAVSGINHRPVFRITFDDGTTIDADDVHRWLTFDAGELAALTRLLPEWRAARRSKRTSRAAGNKSGAFTEAISARNSTRSYRYQDAPTGSVRNTAEIAASVALPSGRSNHAIPMATALILPAADLPIDPYVLGAWLGDGNSRQASITCYDPEILDHIAAAGFRISPRTEHGAFGVNDGLIGKLRSAALLANKRIPQAYLRASLAQRVSLLQGLMDTDGNCTASGACEFTTTAPALRDGMSDLLASLGIKSVWSEGRAKLDGRDIGPKYRFKFMAPFAAFRLARKAERQNLTPRRTCRFRYVKSVVAIESVPTKCVAVDSADRLFLAGRQMVPTHNSDLLIGLACTQHRTSVLFRRQDPQLAGLQERAEHIIGDHGKFNMRLNRWRLKDGRIVRFGSMDKEEHWKKWQGRPHDFYGFDEITPFTETQFRNVTGWTRLANGAGAGSTQRTRVICAGNPPTDAEGLWVIDFWGPWLDERHPNPAKEGELRWYVTIDGKDIEVPDGSPAPHYDERLQREELLLPKSRTFIRSLVTDNPILMASGYMATLQGLPEPMRSQMLYGDFRVGQNDAEDQVIPSAWVQAAMDRWHDPMSNQPPKPGQISPRDEESGKIDPMDALGVDVARGGKDKTVLTPRHGRWFGRQSVHPGKSTPDGPEVLRLIVGCIPVGSDPQVKIDVIGVGSSPYDFAKANALDAYAMNGKMTSKARMKGGRMKFANMRAQWWWQLREALDPSVPEDEALAIPPDRELFADLISPRYRTLVQGIQIEEKADIKERIGRSPDKGESLVYAHGQPKRPSALIRPVDEVNSPPIAIYQR